MGVTQTIEMLSIVWVGLFMAPAFAFGASHLAYANHYNP